MMDLHMFDYSFLQDTPPQGVSLLLRETSRLQARLLDQKRAYPAIYSALESAGRGAFPAVCLPGWEHGEPRG